MTEPRETAPKPDRTPTLDETAAATREFAEGVVYVDGPDPEDPLPQPDGPEDDE